MNIVSQHGTYSRSRGCAMRCTTRYATAMHIWDAHGSQLTLVNATVESGIL
ncbi:MAG: hypothetical protein MJZ97_12835 [Bacteroidales bacterium]|nr:hypothetical protein [Bacteroidales bacterium]